MALGLHESGALQERFLPTGFEGSPEFDASDYAALINARQSLQDLTEEGLKRSVQIRVGMGDARSLGGGLNSIMAAEAMRQAVEAIEKEEKERHEDAILQNLLNQLSRIDQQIDNRRHERGELVAEQEALQVAVDALNDKLSALENGEMSIEEAMQDPDIAALIEQWERENGTEFNPDDPNAQQVIEELMRAKRDEYLGRIDAIGNRIDEIDAEIEDLQRDRDRIEADVIALTQMKADGVAPEVVAEMAEEISRRYQGADEIGADQGFDASAEEEIARSSQEEYRADDLATEQGISALDAMFGGDGGLLMAAPALVDPPSEKLAASTQDARQQFGEAAAQPNEDINQDIALENSPDFGVNAG